MEETVLTDIHSPSTDFKEDSNDSTDSSSIDEDSTNVESKNTKLTYSNDQGSEIGDEFDIKEHETDVQADFESELNSDPYPDLVDELSGIIYISRIPPFMGLSKLRSYFSNFGRVGKVYAHPEPIGQYKKRVKMGGNKRLKFTHAWIQFYDKSVAKNVAKLLNNKPFSDTKRSSFWKYDIWNIKYLPKFKWHHLVEYWSEHKRESKEQLNLLLQRERKRNLRYLEQLEIEKREHQIELKRKGKKESTNSKTDATTEGASNTATKTELSIKEDAAMANTSATRPKRLTHKKRKNIKSNESSDKQIPLNLLNSIAL
ncbi:hypothetical protein MACJ_000249 [Theileria orientalis]|uniref:Activator of basal transcription 1 n=1 Tax=Theileria orientalis TaxID=68886 RepID=A0A976M3R2_THEOR|nr:hypothetical protein MACJ_000249 [Theileria orientalis]